MHRRELLKLRRCKQRYQNNDTDKTEWSKQMVNQFQSVLTSEREKSILENKQNQAAVKLISNVNLSLELDNVRLNALVSKLQTKVIELTSSRLVESVLLQQSVLKDVWKEQERVHRIEVDLQDMAVQQAFAYGSLRSKKK